MVAIVKSKWQTNLYCIHQSGIFLLSMILAMLVTSCASNGNISEAEITASNVNKLQIVDCLLPGQVRKLGTSMTYLTSRRPTRTTAANCEIRGGEYVAFDRADYATALKTWLPKASEGDAEAQTYVGEIYEKGLGIAPDYQMAAIWYGKATQQGYATAQTNLGYLYEKGLGVEQNSVTALNWYRKASGLENTDIAFAASIEVVNAQIEDLKQQASQYKAESQQYQQESAELKDKLSATERKLGKTRQQLKNRKRDILKERKATERIRQQLLQKKQQITPNTPVTEASAAEIAKFEQTLKQKEAELISKQKTIADLEQVALEQKNTLGILKEGAERFATETNLELEALRTELAQGNAESSQLQKELQQTQSQLLKSQQNLGEQSRNLQQREKALQQAQKKLTTRLQQATSARDNAELAKLNQALNERELALQVQRQALDKLKQERETLANQNQEKQLALKEHKNKIADLTTRIEREKEEKALAESATSKLAKLTGPRIEIIEPPLIVQRGALSIRTRSGLDKRIIIGKVSAPAGLMTLFINDKEESVDKSGVFKVNIPLRSKTTPIQIVALDKNSKRTEMKFTIERPQQKPVENTTEPDPSPSLAGMLPRSLFGKYYAVLIGNNTYPKLPHLDTAINDAKAVGEILKNKYGFETKVLLNATRYDILNALNEYRKILTDKDNLFIYYAGHGMLDKVNDRGHWLPTDAEPDSSANWISVQTVTDQLKIISAKHVLVVADSCYSGALTRSSIARLEAGMTTEKRAQWIKLMLKARSRVALSSGGLEPVLDGGGGSHSIFAKALIDSLRKNNDLMESQTLYRNVSALVADAASEQDFKQVPEFAAIRHAGHAAGEFFFYPSQAM